MAAPLSSYDSRLLKRKTTPAENFQLAKLLSEYTDYATTKTLFHLDKMLMLKDGYGNLFFIGLISEGGSNAVFHSLSRRGATKFRGYVSLLDAGLNCRAEVPIFQTQGGVPTKLDILNNSILLRALFKSSYYNSTTSHTVDIANSENLNSVISASLGEIAANTEKVYTGEIIIVPDTMIFYVGKTYVLTLKAINEEGNINSNTLSLSPVPVGVNLKYGSTLDSAIASSSGSTVYINRRISDAEASDGVVFFSNVEASLYAGAGYYVSTTADVNGIYKYYRVTGSAGAVTEIGEIVSRHQDVYHYYSTISDENAISYSPVERVLYYKIEITPPGSDFENRTYYDGPFVSSSYAAEGYYVKSDRTTSIYIGANGETLVLIES